MHYSKCKAQCVFEHWCSLKISLLSRKVSKTKMAVTTFPLPALSCAAFKGVTTTRIQSAFGYKNGRPPVSNVWKSIGKLCCTMHIGFMVHGFFQAKLTI